MKAMCTDVWQPQACHHLIWCQLVPCAHSVRAAMPTNPLHLQVFRTLCDALLVVFCCPCRCCCGCPKVKLPSLCSSWWSCHSSPIHMCSTKVLYAAVVLDCWVRDAAARNHRKLSIGQAAHHCTGCFSWSGGTACAWQDQYSHDCALIDDLVLCVLLYVLCRPAVKVVWCDEPVSTRSCSFLTDVPAHIQEQTSYSRMACR
jgi:hypothetical protein